MNNLVKQGLTTTFTAPAGGVVSGQLVRIGQLVVIATNTVAATLPFEGATFGEFNLPKIAGVAWAEGQMLYHDSTANNIGTVVSATTMRVGVAAAVGGQLAGDTVGLVRLNGVPAPLNTI